MTKYVIAEDKMTTTTVPRNKMWTKVEIGVVLDLWTTQTASQIANKIGCHSKHVNYIATQMRKAGVDLPRKSVRGYLRTLIEEVKKEHAQ